jgi:hypothetical protein
VPTTGGGDKNVNHAAFNAAKTQLLYTYNVSLPGLTTASL